MSGGAEGGRRKAEGVPEGWRETTVGNLCDLINGYGFKEKDWAEEGLPIIRIQNLNGSKNFNYYAGKPKDSWIVETGNLLFSWAGVPGVSFGPFIWHGDRGVLNQHIFRVIPKDQTDSNYLFSLLKVVTSRIEESAHGFKKSLLHVKRGDITEQAVFIPPLPEQRKIAAILSTWDDSIATLTQLLEAKRQQKRGLAEELLTGKKRLPGFEGEWEAKRLGEVFTRITRKNTEGNEHALTISGTLGLIDQREFFNKRVAAADLSGYYLIRRGEFAYNKSYSAGYAYGAIKRLNRYDAGVVSTLYICFAVNQADANSDFYEQFFEAGLLNEGISGIAQEGARNHGLLNVSAKDFFELPIVVPAPAEQKAIASVLSTLDAEIASLEALRAKVQEQKRGLMDELLTGRVRVKVEEA